MNDMQRTAPVRSKTAQLRKLAPAGSPAARVNWPKVLNDACRIIERDAPRLEDLAVGLGVGRSELQRQFTRRLGVSPKAYAQALALHRLARGAGGGRTALDAVFDAGFGTNSAAYATASETLGTTPGRLRGAFDIGWWMGLSDLGWMLLGATARGICWLAFGEAPGAMLEELRAAFPKANLYNDESRLYGWFEKVRGFVLLPREALDLPLDIQGTAFQSRVWRALRQIPLGGTEGYGELAHRLGQPGAARAVASACARNPAALLIPCHRVIAADGKSAGYRWGADRKRQLLQREASVRESESSRTQSRARNQPLMLSRSR
jgi:AraC family transcriptional regulator of adaptative response/methylated-DNA-[protein]-cysteine methyltransferase